MKIELDIWNTISGYKRLSHYTLSENDIMDAIRNHLIQTDYIEPDEIVEIEISSVTV